jgi:cytochrome c
MKNRNSSALTALTLLAALLASQPVFADADFDADGAKKLAKDNDCFKCHAIDKTKKGPSLKKIAAKYREKKLDETEMIKHMTSGKKVKLEDGSEEDHKIIDTKDVKAQANLARWILSH